MWPSALAVDANNNVYVSDLLRVRRIDSQGIITTVAGNGEPSVGGDGGPATGALLSHPRGMTFDAAGNLYIADAGNQRVRKVSPTGVITTVAGGPNRGYAGDGGPATEAEMIYPSDVAIDRDGNIYVADSYWRVVRRIDGRGYIDTVAGSGWRDPFAPESQGAPARQVNLQELGGITLDASGNVYIANGTGVLRVDRSRRMAAIAGGGNPSDGLGDGLPARSARLYWVLDLAFDSGGRLLLLDKGHNRIRRIDNNGIISTIAGNGVAGYSGDGGPGTAASFNFGFWPDGLATDASGATFVADPGNQRVRRIGPDGAVTTITGTGGGGFSGDGGPAAGARINIPIGIALDGAGNLFFSDAESQRVRRVTNAGAAPAPPPSQLPWVEAFVSTMTTSTTTTTTTTPPPPANMQAPYGAWRQPSGRPLDGVGTWVAIANDPAAAAGQSGPAYFYGLGFGFTSGGANGSVGLTVGPEGKRAVVAVSAPGTPKQSFAVPFEWSANRFYFPLVYQLGGETWGAWVYDHTGAAWTYIGTVSVPNAGRLSPGTVTAIGWSGPAATACSAYPKADVYMHSPTGLVGTAAEDAVLSQTGATHGTCPSQASSGPTGWMHLIAGS